MTEIFRKAESWFILSLLALWTFVWDYDAVGDYQRDGKLKFVIAAAAILAAFRVAKIWHWSVAVFYIYLIGSWLHFCFHPWVLEVAGRTYTFNVRGNEEVATITAILFLCPLIDRAISRRMFENLIIGAASIHAAIGILNLRGVYPFLPLTIKVTENLPIGLLGQQTILGPFLAYGFSLSALRAIQALRTRDMVFYAAFSSFLFCIAVMTKSSMTYGSLAVGLLTILLFYYGWATVLVGAMGVAGALLFARHHFDPYVFNPSGRLEPWKDAFSLYHERPWFGFGIGSWEPIAQIIKDVRGYQFAWIYLHSEPIQGLFELGRIGMAVVGLVGAIVLIFICQAFKRRDASILTWVCAITVFGSDSLANFILHLVPHGPIFALGIFQVLRSGRHRLRNFFECVWL